MAPEKARSKNPVRRGKAAAKRGSAAKTRRKKADEPIAESDVAQTSEGGLSEFTRRVRAVVRAVPHGRVVSYGGVAAIVGQPRAARAVGRALCTLPDGDEVPWWRVINRNAEISIKCVDHGPSLQRALLEGEGVRFDSHGRTDWKRFGWDGADVPEGIRDDDASDVRVSRRGARGTVRKRAKR